MKVKSQKEKGKTASQKSKVLNFKLWFLLFTFYFSLFNISCAQNEGLNIGDKAPDFTLEDTAGHKVNLQDTVKAGKATLLVFWATWCPYCTEEIPDLIKLNNDYSSKGLKILAVDIGENRKKAASFATAQGINYTVLLDTENRVAEQYGIMGIPANVLIDKDGVIKYRGTKPPAENLLPQ